MKAKQKKRKGSKMKNFWEYVLIAVLFFVAATALLTVDKRAAENSGYEEAFSAKKVEIFQHMH